MKQYRDREGTRQEGRDELDWKGLFAALADGSRAALEELYDRLGRRLYGLALWRTGSPEDAGDVVQDVFVKLVEQAPKLAKVKQPERWLLTVTHRQAIDVTRRRKRRRTESFEETAYLQVAAGCPDRDLDAARASRLLAELPPEQRTVLYLHLFCDFTFSAIGAIVGAPTFTAASRYRLGIGKLRRLLEKAS